MPVYTNISAKFIINKLYRDLALEDPNYELDFIEWIGESLQFIGSGSQLQKIEGQQLAVADHKAKLPYALLTIRQLRYYDEDLESWKVISFNPRNFNPHEKDSKNLSVNTEESYSLNPNFIETTFETGIIELNYTRFPIDEDGYPLVPDNQYFKEALFWYCYKKIILQGYQPRVEELTYTFADSQWKFYCSAARNKANYPDIDQYERFREMWVGLLPPSEMIDNGFDLTKRKDLGIELIDATNTITTPTGINEVDLDGGDLGDSNTTGDTTAPTISNTTITITEL